MANQAIKQNDIALGKNLEAVLSTKPPSMLKLFWRELIHDKPALISLFLFTFLVLAIFILAPYINANYNVMWQDLSLRNLPPSEAAGLYNSLGERTGFLGLNFGTNAHGRDIARLTIVSARNSLIITFVVTFLSFVIGVAVGLFSGFYGGHVDNVIMRVTDTWSMLPTLMVLIAIISILDERTMGMFIVLLTLFTWMGRARLVRAAALQNRNMDYIAASKTLGTRNLTIIFREMVPNLVDVIVANFVLTLAANMGIEVGITILGFGLGWHTPTLGTMINQAIQPVNLQFFPWVWAPAIILVFTLMLCIHFIGTALQRVSDPKQRYA